MLGWPCWLWGRSLAAFIMWKSPCFQLWIALSSVNKAAFCHCNDSPSLYLSRRAHSHPLTALLYYLLDPKTQALQGEYHQNVQMCLWVLCLNIFTLYIYIYCTYTLATNVCNCKLLALCFHLDFTDYHIQIKVKKWLMRFSFVALRQ